MDKVRDVWERCENMVPGLLEKDELCWSGRRRAEQVRTRKTRNQGDWRTRRIPSLLKRLPVTSHRPTLLPRSDSATERLTSTVPRVLPTARLTHGFAFRLLYQLYAEKRVNLGRV